MSTPSIEQLRRAIEITERIEKLEAELRALLGAGGSIAIPAKVSSASPAKPGRKKRVMSPEGRARIVAAQKARWALLKGSSGEAAEPKKGKKAKRVMSPEAREKIAAAAKKRWAKAKEK